MKKHIIEIECPDEFIPKYNSDTRRIELIKVVPDKAVRTFEDAVRISGATYIGTSNSSVNSLQKLQIILDVLNDGYKFNLVKGEVWYPWVSFYEKSKTPEKAKVIRDFCYQGVTYTLIGGDAYGDYRGLSEYHPNWKLGNVNPCFGCFACKDKETASYVSTQFGQLIFEACFLRYFNIQEFT